MAEASKPVEVSLRCLYEGCEATGVLRIHPGQPSLYGYSYSFDVVTPGWLCYAPGYPSAKSLGICPSHQRVTLEGQPPIDVEATKETHGTFFTLSSLGRRLGRVTFPTNTLTLQLALGGDDRESAELWGAGRRVAAQFGFKTGG